MCFYEESDTIIAMLFLPDAQYLFSNNKNKLILFKPSFPYKILLLLKNYSKWFTIDYLLEFVQLRLFSISL